MDRPPHSQGISDVAVLGRKLALTVDTGGTAIVWEGKSPVRIHRLEGSELMACAGCLETSLGVCGTQNDEVITLGKGGAVERFQLASNWYPGRSGISALAAVGKPMTIFAGYFSGEVVFLAATKRGWRRNPASLMATVVSLDPHCRLAASGNVNGEVLIWRCVDGEIAARLAIHQGQVTALNFGHEGRILYSAGADRFIYVIDTSNFITMGATMLPAPAISLLVEEDAHFAALDSSGSIYRFLNKMTQKRKERHWLLAWWRWLGLRHAWNHEKSPLERKETAHV
jgi:WD40 repeat protein